MSGQVSFRNKDQLCSIRGQDGLASGAQQTLQLYAGQSYSGALSHKEYQNCVLLLRNLSVATGQRAAIACQLRLSPHQVLHKTTTRRVSGAKSIPAATAPTSSRRLQNRASTLFTWQHPSSCCLPHKRTCCLLAGCRSASNFMTLPRCRSSPCEPAIPPQSLPVSPAHPPTLPPHTHTHSVPHDPAIAPPSLPLPFPARMQCLAACWCRRA